MSDSNLYIFVVGENYKSKCIIAHYLANKTPRFDQFWVNQNERIYDTNHSISGHAVKIVVTPDLSPSWTYKKKDINSFESKVILYVFDDEHDFNESYLADLDNWFQCRKLHVLRSTSLWYKSNQLKHTSCSETFTLPSETVIKTGVRFYYNESPELRYAKVVQRFYHVSYIIERRFTDASCVNDDIDDRPAEKLERCVFDVLENQDSEQFGLKETEEHLAHTVSELNQSDWELYGRGLNNGSAKYNHIRVNVLGNQGGGKTTLVQRLLGQNPKCPDSGRSCEIDIDIKQVTTKCTVKDGKTILSIIDKGCEEELDIQRMPTTVLKTKEGQQAIIPSNAANQDYEKGSDEIYEDVASYNMSYRNNLIDEQKKTYLQTVKGWAEQKKEESMFISFWDFTGQSVYYATHQAFIAPDAVNLIVFDLSIGLDAPMQSKTSSNHHLLKNYTSEESLKFWVSSIKAQTHRDGNVIAPLIVVGTHKDKVDEAVIQDVKNKIGPILEDIPSVEVFTIDNTCNCETDKDLLELKDAILKVSEDVTNEEVRAQWIHLESILLRKKCEGYLKFSDIVELDKLSDKPITDPEAIKLFLNHEHKRGFLVYLESDISDGIVILDLFVLAKLFNTLLLQISNSRAPLTKSNQHGIVAKQVVVRETKNAFGQDTNTIDVVVDHLRRLNIIHEFQADTLILPFLLPCRNEKNTFRASRECETLPILRMSFKNAFIQHDFFHLLWLAMGKNCTENPALTLREGKDGPVLYTTFVSFDYGRDTMRLDMCLQNCMVYFHLKNYSKAPKIDVKGTIMSLLEFIKYRLKQDLELYRKKSVDYHFEVECPHHPNEFIDLTKVFDKREAMCNKDNEEHALTLDQVLRVSPKLKKPVHSAKPSHRDLGRLCRQLSSDNAKCLAVRLKLRKSTNIAIKAKETWPGHSDMQRYYLLTRWKRENIESTTSDLIRRLSKTGDYNEETLHRVLLEDIKKCQYDLTESYLMSAPNEIAIAEFSECIGSEWCLLLIELGMNYTDLETAMSNDPYDLTSRARNLLLKWKQSSASPTLQTLLDTAHYVGVNVKEIEMKLKT